MLDLFQTGFRLGTCSVDPKSGLIERPDGISRVSPKAMEVLVCLARKPGRLIQRKELIHAGWGDDRATHEEALTRYVAELRAALNDHHDNPEYILTVPRRGYRLIAPVTTTGTVSSDDEARSDAAGFWDELKRRDVVRASLAYAAFAWLGIEVLSVIGPIFGVPEWTLQALVVTAVVGFPLVVALSWAVQKTPEGLALDMPVADRPPGLKGMTARRVDYIIIGVLAVAVVFLLFREFQLDSASLAPSEHSIAVLPFDNLSGDETDEYIVDGLAEEILNLLAQTRDLDVTSRKASFYYKNKDVPLTRIADDLRVRNLVEGSVQRSGERIRITVQLIDTKSLLHRWSDTYDTQEDDLIGVRDAVARRVAVELKTAIAESGEQMIAQDAATDRQAYMLYLRARGELRKEYSPETLATAERLLQEAIGIDSDFARAWAALCDCFLSRFIHAGSEEVYYEKGKDACERALSLDYTSAEVFTALGNLYRVSGETDEALIEFEQALVVAPKYYDAIYGVAQTHEARGDLARAETWFRKLTSVEPGYWHSYNALGHFLYAQSRYGEAVENFQRVATLDPDNSIAYNNLGAAHYMVGDYAGAASAWEESARIRPSYIVLSNIGLAAYYAGDFEKAATMQTRAIAEAPEDYRIWGRLGDAERHRGMTDAANAAYAEAIRFAGRAVDINPSNEEALRYLSLYYTHTDDNAAAIRAIERARELQPGASRIHYFASKVYLAAGDMKRATHELNEALRKGYSRELANADPDLAPLKDVLKPDTQAAVKKN